LNFHALTTAVHAADDEAGDRRPAQQALAERRTIHPDRFVHGMR
jgi:hypothetical protein